MPTPTADTPRRVLVVEDCLDSAYVLSVLLGKLDCKVRVVSNPAEALKVADAFRPDIALLDLAMPNIDGYRLATAFRVSNAFPTLRIIALTGYGDELHKEHARRVGFDDYLVKPYAIDVLQEALERF